MCGIADVLGPGEVCAGWAAVVFVDYSFCVGFLYEEVGHFISCPIGALGEGAL